MRLNKSIKLIIIGLILLLLIDIKMYAKKDKLISFEFEFIGFRLNGGDIEIKTQITNLPQSLRTIYFDNYLNVSPLNGSSIILPDVPAEHSLRAYLSSSNFATAKLWLFSTVALGAGFRSGGDSYNTFGSVQGVYKGNWGYYWNGSLWFTNEEKTSSLRLLAEIKLPSIRIYKTQGNEYFEINFFAGCEPFYSTSSLSIVKECYWWGSYIDSSKLCTSSAKLWYAGIDFQSGEKNDFEDGDFCAGFKLYVAKSIFSHEPTYMGKTMNINFSDKFPIVLFLSFYFIL